MKKILCLMPVLFGLYLTQSLAQAPQKFKYQAVARQNDNLFANSPITVRVSLCANENCTNPNPLYRESHGVSTNEIGLFSIEIGNGQVLTGDFSQINWEGAERWMRIEIQPNSSGSFINMGTTQLLSVPYALYAERAGSDGDSDPANELQTLSKIGNIVTLSPGGSSFVDEVNDADANPTNEIQQLSLSGNNLSISGNGGNTIVLPSSNRVAFLKDVKFVDTPGGDVTGEFWHSRILNTISGDNSFVSLTGGSTGTNGTATQFILQPGTYHIEAFCPAQQINVHVAKLVNVTDGQDVLIGSAGYSPVNVHAISPSIIMGQFTINSAKTFAIMHRGASSRPNGFGVSHWWSDNVYTQVKIEKVD